MHALREAESLRDLRLSKPQIRWTKHCTEWVCNGEPEILV